MHHTTKLFLILFLAVLNVSCSSGIRQANISAADQHIQYSGRIDFSTKEAPYITWPGTMIQANFTGTSLAVILDDTLGNNYFNVFLDNDWQNPIVIDCKSGRNEYLLAENLSPGSHSLTISKRTEGHEGGTYFHGLILDKDARLNTPPPRPLRRIEFYGDSVTSGLGNEAAMSAGDKNMAEKNNYLSYAAITARALNAEHVSISSSGIGLMVSWFNWTMTDYYDQLDGSGVNGKKWDFSQWTPDVVVINLMQNDSWLVDSEFSPPPTKMQRIKAYYNFIYTLRSKYPDAHIIAALGGMDAVKPGSPWPEYIRKAVAQYRKDFNDNKVDSFFFDYNGFNKHPRVKHHQAMADKLTAFISEKMNWHLN
ncbi:SGNH/GDSL hydrolase family protein [Psychromonas aquimarina]|uniref:SGNH/GDSL hydrolase family protein n=1 Tax=Psychromonas aquimarina TaxID=444919 RepID=UPI000415FEB0|nr:SGNH/GDSL hydrolase family protein [Psychromonas aquimarina]